MAFKCDYSDRAGEMVSQGHQTVSDAPERKEKRFCGHCGERSHLRFWPFAKNSRNL